MIKLAITFILASIIAGCAYGPETEKKSPLNVLNGENYDAPSNGPGDNLMIPVVKRKERDTEIRGEVRLRSGLDAVPLQGVVVGLLDQDGKKLAEATSGVGGEFTLTATAKNGHYRLKAMGGKYNGECPVTVDNYEVKGILLQVHRRH